MRVLVIPFWIFMAGLAADFVTLEDLRWKKRVLLVFPNDDGEKDFCWEVPEDLHGELEERDLVYFVFADSLLTNSDYRFDEAYVEHLKKRYALGSRDLCWVLLGKDGGSKIRKEGVAPDWQELFVNIDSMPLSARKIKVGM